jgi:dTDP-4-dehydrorhamnose reductase
LAETAWQGTWFRFLQTCPCINAVRFEDLVAETFRITPATLGESEQVIESLRPQVLVNCIGSLISASRANPSNAIFTNSYLPNWLASLGDTHNYRLIHISTDCVFSGRDGHYREDAFRDADDIYGRSKALGEIDSPKHLTIRTSIIGPELKKPGGGLFDWLMRQSGQVRGFSRVYWNGITTVDLARAIELAIRNRTSGLVQVSHKDSISKRDLLLQIASAFHLPVEVEDDPAPSHDKSLLQSSRFPFTPLDYPEMLADLSKWVQDHREIYTNYFASK